MITVINRGFINNWHFLGYVNHIQQVKKILNRAVSYSVR